MRSGKQDRSSEPGPRYRIVSTAAGFVGIVAGGRGVQRVHLPAESRAAALRGITAETPAAKLDAALLPKLADDLQKYFAGAPVEFDHALDWSGHSAFQSQVWKACGRIPYGKTKSYKDLAERVGRPRGARAVGMAMSRNPWPIVVPCHRVLRSDGSPGGYSGQGGVPFKQRLLEMEAGGEHIC